MLLRTFPSLLEEAGGESLTTGDDEVFAAGGVDVEADSCFDTEVICLDHVDE
jgi:hypothetical protein